MRILADESVQRASVEALRAGGHDVAWVLSDAPGTRDEAVLARAGVEQRTVVVADKDFGDLVFEQRLPAPYGVILLRAKGSAEARARVLVNAVATRDDWAGLFVVVENDRTRIRRVPSADDEPC